MMLVILVRIFVIVADFGQDFYDSGDLKYNSNNFGWIFCSAGFGQDLCDSYDLM